MASKERLQELVALLVDRVDTADKAVSRIHWTAAARPFFRDMARECAVVAPPAGLGGVQPAQGDRLEYYAAAS